MGLEKGWIMNELKRYTHSWKHSVPQMVKCDYGDWIKIDDYAKLQDENNTLVMECDDLKVDAIDQNTKMGRLQAILEVLMPIAEGMAASYKDEPCWHDHHGYCQAHFLHDKEDCPYYICNELIDRQANLNPYFKELEQLLTEFYHKEKSDLSEDMRTITHSSQHTLIAVQSAMLGRLREYVLEPSGIIKDDASEGGA